MKLIKKLIPFLVVFFIIFYFIRTSAEYNLRVIAANSDGVSWLYAVVGTLFGVLAAFVIQKEWGKWDALTEAVRGEVDDLDNPLEPGDWHITTKDHEALLAKVSEIQ
jgi:hypothetical protein